MRKFYFLADDMYSSRPHRWRGKFYYIFRILPQNSLISPFDIIGTVFRDIFALVFFMILTLIKIYFRI